MEWISVKDKLPETQESVLAFCGKSMRVASYCKEGWLLSGSFHEYDEYDEDWNYDAVYLKVSHWTPLPSPPNQE